MCHRQPGAEEVGGKGEVKVNNSEGEKSKLRSQIFEESNQF